VTATTAHAPSRARLRVLLLAALAVLIALLLPAGTASAATLPATQTGVGVSHPAATRSVGLDQRITAGQRRDGPRSQLQIVSGHCVAAEEASNLAPQLDKAFQFGGAGRSGAAVKNFVGPQNAVVRGASQGRVFLTDSQGRVILDITRDRVKPVVPGQGFVAGDGRKLAPTQEQLGWIDQLWGG
jgi:hypothetical protein